MAEKHITVFGGSGFLGHCVVQRLAATGAIIRVAGRHPSDAYDLQPLGDVGQIVALRADVRDPVATAAACAGVDAVVNLVGILYESGKSSFRAIHVEGAGNVARAAAEAGATRLVHLSAIGADRRAPSEYGRSKAAGEKAVRDAFPAATILRPSVIFGPEDSFFNKFAALARILPVLPVFGCPPPRLVLGPGGPSLDLYGDGGSKFQPAYVGDVADAVARVIARAEHAGATFELGGPNVYSFRALMEMLLAQIGRKRWLVPVPFWVAAVQAFFLEMVPGAPLLTRDQLRMMRRDNVVGRNAAGFADLGIAPRAPETILPTYLDIYRKGGQFASRVVI